MSDAKLETVSKNELERRERFRDVRRRRIKKVVILFVVLALAAAGIYSLVSWTKKSEETKPGEAIQELGAEHVPPGTKIENYNSNPPTSGQHYPQPANWGVYEEQLPDELLVHNLEHGGIWISYKNPEDTALIEQLKSIVDDFSLKVIMTPRPENDAPVAVAAWGRLMKLDGFDEDKIRDFISTFINRGPEQVPY